MLRGTTIGAFFSLLLLCAPAQAEMLYLKCGQWGIITVDLANHTANGRPAVITPTMITWDGPSEPIVSFYIDRTSGRFSGSIHFHSPQGDYNRPLAPDTCTRTTAPRTKF